MEFTFYTAGQLAQRADYEQFENAVEKIRAAHDAVEVTVPYNYKDNIEGFRTALNREIAGGVIILNVGLHTASVLKIRGG